MSSVVGSLLSMLEGLDENLGNLDLINKDILKSFTHGKSLLAGTSIGPDSSIATYSIPFNAKKIKDLITSDPSIVLIVIEINGKQSIAIGRKDLNQDSRKYSTYGWKIDVRNYSPDTATDTPLEKLESDVLSSISTKYSYKNELTDKTLVQALNVIEEKFKSISHRGLAIRYHVVSSDQTRAVTTKERGIAKVGMIPLPNDKDYEKYISTLKSNLNSKFKQFKSDKVAKLGSLTTGAEVKSFLLENGYVNLISFAGQVYELYNANINLSSLIKKASGIQDNSIPTINYTITYKMDVNSSAYKAAMEMKYDSEDRENWRKSTPDRILIELKLDKATITVDDIKFEYNSW